MAETNPQPEFLNRKEAAELLRVSVPFLAVDAVTRKHKVPFYKIGAKAVYRRSEIEAWLASRAVKA